MVMLLLSYAQHAPRNVRHAVDLPSVRSALKVTSRIMVAVCKSVQLEQSRIVISTHVNNVQYIHCLVQFAYQNARLDMELMKQQRNAWYAQVDAISVRPRINARYANRNIT